MEYERKRRMHAPAVLCFNHEAGQLKKAPILGRGEFVSHMRYFIMHSFATQHPHERNAQIKAAPQDAGWCMEYCLFS